VRRAALLAAGLGAAQTLAFVHTALWALPLLACAALVALLARAKPARAALLAWAYGTAWVAAGTWWLFVSMHRYGGLPAPLAAAAVLALAAALSAYLALAGALWARWRSGAPLPDALRFAALWLLAEWARGVVFTGFPWVASGYAMVDGPLAVWAPWVGVYGMGFGLALAAAALALGVWPGPGSHATATATATGPAAPSSVRRRALTALVVAAALALPWAAGPADFTRSAGSLDVRLVQTQVAQDEKFALERLPNALAWLQQALTAPDPPGAAALLVVAPETAVPLLPQQLDEFAPGWWAALQAHFVTGPGAAAPAAPADPAAPAVAPGPPRSPGPPRAALVGVPLGDFDTGYTNSVVALTAAPQPDAAAGRAAGLPPGAAYRYDKWHLVPFGEFVPPGFRWFTEMMQIPLGDFARGVRNPPSLHFAGQRIGPNICYEDLFGEELARRFADPAAAPTVLANVSNIAWFGDTIAVAQHLNISRLRSLELQRPMVRATNTGATAVVDHRGRVTAALPPTVRGALDATVQGRDGVTPYAAWAARLDLWPLVALALALLAGLHRLSPPRGGTAPAASAALATAATVAAPSARPAAAGRRVPGP
jgi:apolipoprotein N-acyltransferase